MVANMAVSIYTHYEYYIDESIHIFFKEQLQLSKWDQSNGSKQSGYFIPVEATESKRMIDI